MPKEGKRVMREPGLGQSRYRERVLMNEGTVIVNVCTRANEGKG